MKILLTNDDGIHAPGLFALHETLKSDHDLHIVAPEAEMSAVGHAPENSNRGLVDPIRVKTVQKNGCFFGYAVSGTPADCVKIAVQELLDPPPDIILSGINWGNNVGVNILYSGTVSAATEGAFLGIPSAAISLGIQKKPGFAFAARFSRNVIRFLAEGDLKDGIALNVNMDLSPFAGINPCGYSGLRVTQLSQFGLEVDPVDLGAPLVNQFCRIMGLSSSPERAREKFTAQHHGASGS